MPLPPFEQLKNDWNSHTIKFTLCPTLWQDAQEINTFFENLSIQSIKFFNDDCSAINQNITILPNNKGGIYFFILKNDVLPNLSSHIMYKDFKNINFNLNERPWINVVWSPQDGKMATSVNNSFVKNMFLYLVEPKILTEKQMTSLKKSYASLISYDGNLENITLEKLLRE